MDRYEQALRALVDTLQQTPPTVCCDKAERSALHTFVGTLQGTPGAGPEEFVCTAQATTAETIPVGISNRHVHLSRADVETLFGVGYQLTPLKELSQPGQFSAKETVTIAGPKRLLEHVRILGPERPQTQVELLRGDCIKLGIEPCIRISGDITQSPGITLIGPEGSVRLPEGVIVAQRHIHMTPQDADRFGVCDGDHVCIKLVGSRGGVYDQVVIRATPSSSLDCHLDIEEANGMGIGPKTTAHIVNCI